MILFIISAQTKTQGYTFKYPFTKKNVEKQVATQNNYYQVFEDISFQGLGSLIHLCSRVLGAQLQVLPLPPAAKEALDLREVFWKVPLITKTLMFCRQYTRVN